jgi:uncharacterized protein (DUF1778 family)
MAGIGTKDAAGRGENINLRATQRQKALIDRAAQVLGRTRSDFMLETACREAEAVLLDRRYFVLSENDFRKFTAMLDRPPNDAVLRTIQAAAIAGIRVILVHAISQAAKRFYEKYGFVASPVDPMTVMITVAEAIKILDANN